MIEQFFSQLIDNNVVVRTLDGWDNLVVNGPLRAGNGRAIDFHRHFHNPEASYGPLIPLQNWPEFIDF